ncbi:MAG: winged helix-turn-helix domain-containing protein [Candidatus Woesearchaeota archaeon]
MENKLVIDRETLKALVVETRLDILKLLCEKKYTQSDLAELLGISKPSVKEHLDILEKAKLIKKEETTRKWKYYSATLKGSYFIKPRDIQVMFAFVINTIAIVAVSAFKLITSRTTAEPQAAEIMMVRTVDAAEPMVAADFAQTSTTLAPTTILLIVLAITAALFLGYLLKKRTLIIKTKHKR